MSILMLFKEWLVEEGKAVKTIESYTTDVWLFQNYLLEKDVDPEVLLTRFLFVQYREHLLKQKFFGNNYQQKG